MAVRNPLWRNPIPEDEEREVAEAAYNKRIKERNRLRGLAKANQNRKVNYQRKNSNKEHERKQKLYNRLFSRRMAGHIDYKRRELKSSGKSNSAG